ncbi:MAG: hypothetical protein WKF37_16040 [Bryobacteraceae bacterium]
MTTVKIDIPDQQAAALSAKAAAQGMTLENWFQKVAEKEAGRPDAHKAHRPKGSTAASLKKCASCAPPSNRIPKAGRPEIT